MFVLIDYDNVPALHRSRGVEHVITRVLEPLGPAAFGPGEHLRVRLYGGWFEESSLTRVGQAVAADLSGFSPRAMTVVQGSTTVTVIVAAELADSLLVSPRRVLENTYRAKGTPRNLRCPHPPFPRCASPSACPLSAVHALITSASCPFAGCLTELHEVITRAEQKLVDSMLTADIIHVAHSTETKIVVVSSDEDIWPGVLSAVTLGTTVYHVHPKPGRTIPVRYSAGMGSQYIELTTK